LFAGQTQIADCYIQQDGTVRMI